MNTMDKKYFICDVSDFATYLYDHLCLDLDKDTVEQIISNYFQQSEPNNYNPYASLLKPHKPTQKEFELFWNQ